MRKGTRIGRRREAEVAASDAEGTRLWLLSYNAEGVIRDAPLAWKRLGKMDTLDCPGIVWLRVTGIGNRDALQAVGQEFGIHELALKDVCSTQERPKVEVYGETVFGVIRTPRVVQCGDDPTLEIDQVSFVIGPRFLVTFETQPLQRIEVLHERIRRGDGHVRHAGPDYLVQQLVDAAVDECVLSTDVYEDVLELIEDRIVAGQTAGVVAALLRVRRNLLRLRRSLVPLSDAVRSFLSDGVILVRPQNLPHFRDVLDHITQSVERIDGFREMEQGLINLVIATDGARLGESMRVLTVIATLFMPLSFIAGVYGMNFDREASPWSMPELGWPHGYLFALGLMLLVAAGLLGMFWRWGWLKRHEPPNGPVPLVEPPKEPPA